jgi:hypothetical protein
LRQLELDDGYAFLNGFELLADAFNCLLVTHGSLLASPFLSSAGTALDNTPVALGGRVADETGITLPVCDPPR